MTPSKLPSLADFVALVEATDPDAAFRLQFVRQEFSKIYGDQALGEDQGESIADQLERWRYQLLNKNAPNLTANQQDLSDILDMAASVARGSPRSPKHIRAALAASAGTREMDAEFALDSSIPFQEVTRKATELTERHFSVPAVPVPRRRMRLYAPLYLSSYCINHCLYCSFRFPHDLQREHLSLQESLAQAEILGRRGFRHLLLVAGDFPRMTSIPYLVPIVQAIAQQKFSIAVEIAPQSTLGNAQLFRAGACGVTLYQETYQEDLYGRYHPRGPKIWYDWRLEGPERAAEAGMRRLGLGILLGLADPFREVRALIRHGNYLLERFPDIRLAFSLPRIHEAPDDFEPAFPVIDETFIRLYCALRLAFPKAELVLSTREGAALRDRLADICITQMSAGSCTAPGGYDEQDFDPHNKQQFPISDHRSVEEVADRLRRAGFELHWDLDPPEPVNGPVSRADS